MASGRMEMKTKVAQILLTREIIEQSSPYGILNHISVQSVSDEPRVALGSPEGGRRDEPHSGSSSRRKDSERVAWRWAVI